MLSDVFLLDALAGCHQIETKSKHTYQARQLLSEGKYSRRVRRRFWLRARTSARSATTEKIHWRQLKSAAMLRCVWHMMHHAMTLQSCTINRPAALQSVSAPKNISSQLVGLRRSPGSMHLHLMFTAQSTHDQKLYAA